MLSKIFQLCVIMLLVTVFFAGCATDKSAGIYTPEPKKEEIQIDSVQVEQWIKQGNDLFRAGDFMAAEKTYQDILSEYSSKDGAFETALLTNICLCNLETGNRAKFKDCAEKLKGASKNLSYLSRETQMVLKLNEALGKSSSSSGDMRIETRISNGLTEVFKEVK